ncbi:hypothetical protein F4780DRAFT_219674 [Xylariomycetidae sp. FL0641]|nr:hypothetical protein F4780DRAFT_219674 [Xylariomycetidae sp. FL0641]
MGFPNAHSGVASAIPRFTYLFSYRSVDFKEKDGIDQNVKGMRRARLSSFPGACGAGSTDPVELNRSAPESGPEFERLPSARARFWKGTNAGRMSWLVGVVVDELCLSPMSPFQDSSAGAILSAGETDTDINGYSGQWAVGSGQWAVDSGQVELGRPPWPPHADLALPGEHRHDRAHPSASTYAKTPATARPPSITHFASPRLLLEPPGYQMPNVYFGVRQRHIPGSTRQLEAGCPCDKLTRHEQRGLK